MLPRTKVNKIGLFLGSDPSYGGTLQYNLSMLEAVAALPKNDFSVVVAYTSDLWHKILNAYDMKKAGISGGFWGRALSHGLYRSGVPISYLRRIYPRFHPVAKVLVQEECDLWIFPTQDSWSYLIPVPALVTIHDLMHRYERRFPEVSAKGEYLRRERVFVKICKWAKGVLVDSEVGRQQVVESYGMEAGHIYVLPYTVPGYMYSEQIPENFHTRYALPDKFIFYPAQFWEHKNHRRLIEAVASLKHDLPDLKLVLAGSEKNSYDSILRKIQETKLLDDVVFLGYVPNEDMPELYKRARALVMPTFFGPTNIPPLEAFLAGCPVAVSGIYGMPMQVGDAALIFNPESTSEIAESVRRLWTDDELCAALAEKGRRRAALWGRQQFAERLRLIIGQVFQKTD